MFGLRTNVRWLNAIVAIALLWSNIAQAAETKAYLLRGWFGIFSTGLDNIAEQLRAKGIRAEVLSHLSWKTAVAEILQEHAAGNSFRLVLVGHSQGANNVIDMARALAPHKIKVDLLITLAPFMQDDVPDNVVMAVNYFTSPGWGQALTAVPGFHGKISNNNVIGDPSSFHIIIDKDPNVQTAVLREIIDLSQSNLGTPGKVGKKRQGD
jgi:hypothetical protein